jgi:branched-chain amino acid transport system substrate-binding protein
MRRRFGWIALVPALSLAAAGCSFGSSPNEFDGEIKIGVSIEQTGSAQILGEGELRSLNLVTDQINRDGVLGKRLRLVVQDNGSDPARAAKQISDFADTDVVGIVGPGTSATATPAVPVVEQKKIPMVTMGAADGLAQGHKWVFKTPPNGATVVEVLVRELLTLNTQKVGILAVSNQYGDSSLAAVQRAMQASNIGVAGTERFKDSEQDLSGPVGRLVAKDPDVIVVSSIMPGAGYAAAAIKKSKFKGRVFFDSGAGAEIFLSGAKEASDGMYMIQHSILAANHTTATTPSQLAQKEFFAAYTQEYGEFSGYASYAADALNIMVEGIRKADSTDRQAIRDAIERLQYDGLTGSFEFSDKDHGGADGDGLTVLVVQKGAWVLAP